jgi:hypothetical protein
MARRHKLLAPSGAAGPDDAPRKPARIAATARVKNAITECAPGAAGSKKARVCADALACWRVGCADRRATASKRRQQQAPPFTYRGTRAAAANSARATTQSHASLRSTHL